MAVLALKLCPDNLNLEHVLKLCLVHDLPEVIVGDLTPHDDRTTKAEDERKAMEQLRARGVVGFVRRVRAQSTPEAVFVRSLDNPDMALQARVYMNKPTSTSLRSLRAPRKTLGDHELLR